MNIHYQYAGTVKEIYITGEIESKEDKNNFFEVLEDSNVSGLRITFFDAIILPLEVIEKLADLTGEKLCSHVEIIVMEPCLYYYLSRLSIRSRYVKKRLTNGGYGSKLGDIAIQGPAYIIENADSEALDISQVSSFLQDIFCTYGYDYRGYELSSISRRIKKAMITGGVDSFASFRDVVLSDRKAFNNLFIEFSITTTEFFRDPHIFNYLKREVFPYLNSYPHIKIWCAGCSTGQEPYSVAIMLNELGMLHKAHIYATDLNPYAIEEAKNGLYSLECFDRSEDNFKKSGGDRCLETYFEKTKQYVKIKDRYKKNILFFQHSLINSGVLNEFQLILCRNVMIYFSSSLQEKVLKLFYNSLDISGFLVMGSGEGIINNKGDEYFRVYDSSHKIFKRLSV